MNGESPSTESIHHGEVEETLFLSNHTVAMRKALAYCMDVASKHLLSKKFPVTVPTTARGQIDLHLQEEAQQAARNLESLRQTARDELHQSRNDVVARLEDEDTASLNNAIDVVPELSLTDLSPRDFRQRFQQSNLPCKIRHLPPQCFAMAQSQLVRKNGSVNREWFQQCLLGSDDDAPPLLLPVRRSPLGNAIALEAQSSMSLMPNQRLDADGRAMECETQHLTVQQWINLLDETEQFSMHGEHPNTSLSSYYLKDWHLQSWLATNAPQYGPLYQIPPHFGMDLLNRFLTTFCNGDYQFCYWGPAGSYTDWHSDVMHSFSWSYNVCGTKLWTFVIPPWRTESHQRSDDIAAESSPPTVSIHQQAGECIFVPAGWQHCVINETEALSFNHNWITTANLDLVWECLQQEMRSVEVELEAWNHDPNGWEARESMLRGCVGLDVSAYFLMMAVGVLDQLDVAKQILMDGDEESCWELVFDLTRLRDMIRLVTDTKEIRFFDRLLATLADKILAEEAYRLATATLLELIDTIVS